MEKEHYEQYDYEDVKRFAVNQFEYFKVMERKLQDNPERASETPTLEWKAGK